MSDNISTLTRTTYKGSEETYKKIRAEVAKRYGEKEAEKFSPFFNMRTHFSWQQLSCVVKKGEKAFRMTTILEKKDKNGEVIQRYPKSICLFYHLQVEPINK